MYTATCIIIIISIYTYYTTLASPFCSMCPMILLTINGIVLVVCAVCTGCCKDRFRPFVTTLYVGSTLNKSSNGTPNIGPLPIFRHEDY